MNVIKVLKLIDWSTISLIIKWHKDGQSMDTADPSSHNLLKKPTIFQLWVVIKICIVGVNINMPKEWKSRIVVNILKDVRHKYEILMEIWQYIVDGKDQLIYL